MARSMRTLWCALLAQLSFRFIRQPFFPSLTAAHSIYVHLVLYGAFTEAIAMQVPALIQFEGHPEVSETGDLVYVFPGLQRTARQRVRATTRS